jgi:hypothetical protein
MKPGTWKLNNPRLEAEGFEAYASRGCIPAGCVLPVPVVVSKTTERIPEFKDLGSWLQKRQT